MKKFFFLSLLIFFLIVLLLPLGSVEAAERRLEIKYPEVPGVPTPTMEGGIPNYIKYIFNFLIWASGFIAFGVIVYGGFKYLTSTGSPEKIKDAKDQISAALLGLLILFGSYLVLTTINPQLIIFQVEVPPVLPTLKAGVLLCKEPVGEVYSFDQIRESAAGKPKVVQEEIKKQLEKILKKVDKNCWRPPGSGEIESEFNDRVKYVYLISTEAAHYGAILYDESKFGGQADIMYTTREPIRIISYDGIEIKPSSVKVFLFHEPRPEAAVTLYEKIDFNKEDPEKYKSKKYNVDWLATDFIKDNIFLNKVDEQCKDITKEGRCKCHTWGEKCPSKIGSMRVEGKLITIFFRDSGDCRGDWGGKTIIDIHIKTDTNLNNDLMGRWCEETKLRNEKFPCAACMIIISGGVL